MLDAARADVNRGVDWYVCRSGRILVDLKIAGEERESKRKGADMINRDTYRAL